MTTQAAGTTPARLALVRIGRYDLAVDAALVREVVQGPITLTPFPRAAAHVLGAFTYRGRAVPMLDIDALLAPSTGTLPSPRPAAFAMVLQLPSGLCAMQVDIVGDLVTPSPSQISELDVSSPSGAGLFSRLYAADDGGTVAVVLDLESILAIDDLRAALYQQQESDEDLTNAHAVRPLVIVRAGAVLLAFESTAVRQVQRRTPGIAFQMEHPSLRGFHTFRDETLAVVDLLSLLDLPPSESPTAGSHLLIIGYDASDSVALIVDDIVGMEPISLLGLQPVSPDAVANVQLYAGSIVSRTFGITLVLDVGAMLQAASIVDHRLFARRAAHADTAVAVEGAVRAQYVVYSAGGGTVASTLQDLDSIIELPDDFTDLRQPGSPLIGLCERQGRSVQVLDFGVMMGRPPVEEVRRRPVLVMAGSRGLEGFLVESLAFLQDATPMRLPGRPRGTLGLISAPTEMIRARRGEIDVSATVITLSTMTGIATAA